MSSASNVLARAQAAPASKTATAGLGRAALAVFAWAPALVVFAPLALLAFGAFAESWDSRGLSGFTLEAFRSAWTFVGHSAKFSLWLAGLSAVMATAIALPSAYLITQTLGPAPRYLQAAFTLPAVVPAILIAMGMLLAFPTLVGSWTLLLAAYTAQALPFALWPAITALQMVDMSRQEAAARTLGANRWQRLRWLVLPTLVRPAIAGATSAYMICLAESSCGFFLASAEYQPFGVALYNMFQELDMRIAAASAMILIAMLAPPIVLLEYWSMKTRPVARARHRP
jgi:ABC-type Fe3+ transport system permease subunit